MPNPQADVRVGDVIQTRKPHACGGDQWRVYRIGADIGLACLRCDRHIMLPFSQFERALKKRVSTASPPEE